VAENGQDFVDLADIVRPGGDEIPLLEFILFQDKRCFAYCTKIIWNVENTANPNRTQSFLTDLIACLFRVEVWKHYYTSFVFSL